MEPITVYLDADACPVKDEAYKVAARYGLKTYVVSNSFIQIPASPLIERVNVEAGPDIADDWIADRAKQGDFEVTNDIPRAASRSITTIESSISRRTFRYIRLAPGCSSGRSDVMLHAQTGPGLASSCRRCGLYRPANSECSVWASRLICARPSRANITMTFGAHVSGSATVRPTLSALSRMRATIVRAGSTGRPMIPGQTGL